MDKSIAYLVVLLPAIASALLAFFVECMPALAKGYRSFMESRHKVEWLREIVTHAAFYGSAIGAALGLKKDSALLGWIAAAWFIALISAAYALTEHVERLSEPDEDETPGAARRRPVESGASTLYTGED
jgi:hypothetical protein